MKGKINIVITDDQVSYREGLKSVLEDYNIRVSGEAENGKQLLELLKKNSPDVLLLDLEMPVMDGSKTLNIIREKYPDLKTIILSQYEEIELIKDCFNRGVCAYIPKDTESEKLAEAINEVHKVGEYKNNLTSLLSRFECDPKTELYKLIYSKREIDIINLLCQGKTNPEIAEHFGIAEKTVESHLTAVYKNAKVRNRSEFAIYAIKEGLNYLGQEHV